MKDTNKTVLLDIITARSADGFNKSPDIYRIAYELKSVEIARQALLRQLGDILKCETNHVEWITWNTHSLEVRYNNKGAGENTIRSTVRMHILSGKENGKVYCLEIGG